MSDQDMTICDICAREVPQDESETCRRCGCQFCLDHGSATQELCEECEQAGGEDGE